MPLLFKKCRIGIGDDIHNSNAAALEVSLTFISFFITFFFSSTLFQIILYPHFLLLRLRKALHKSLPAGAEASVPMPETRNKRTRIRLILTAHTTICARNILFLHDFYSFFMISTLSESIFLLANPPELLSPGRSGNAQTSDNAPTPRFPTSPSRQMQEGVRHKPWR